MTYRWIEHTGEVELSIEAESQAGVFAEGLTALRDLLAADPHGPELRREVEVTAADAAALFADWLAELAFLAETDGLLPERLASLELDGASLRASVEGRAATPRHLVKAVTYHGLELAQEDGGWRARAVLDV